MSEPKLLRAIYVDDDNNVDLPKSAINSSNPKIKSVTNGTSANEVITNDMFIFSPIFKFMPSVVNGKILIRYGGYIL